VDRETRSIVFVTEMEEEVKNLIRTSMVIVFLAISMQACTSRPTESNEPIAGIYTVKVTPEDTLAAGGNTTVAYVAQGSWQLEFTQDGEYRLTRQRSMNPKLEEVVPYHVSGDKLILESTTSDYACFPGGGEGTYHWKLSGGQLTLTAIQDDCYRKGLFIAKPWTKQP
jgi:hypothetical protein